MLNKLLNKNVLFFDLETTGLPTFREHSTGKNKYYAFNQNKYYDSSRIVSIAWCLIEEFTAEKLEDPTINYTIRKPINFKVTGERSTSHYSRNSSQGR